MLVEGVKSLINESTTAANITNATAVVPIESIQR